MIQPSALPAAGNPLLAPVPQNGVAAEAGGNPSLTAQFAGLLAEKLGLGPAEAEPEALAPAAPPAPANPVAALRAALSRAFGAVSQPANGKPPGKPDGKSLPDVPESPEAAARPWFAASEDLAPDTGLAAAPTGPDPLADVALPANVALTPEAALSPEAALPAAADATGQISQGAPEWLAPDLFVPAAPDAEPQWQPAAVRIDAAFLADPAPVPGLANAGILPVIPEALRRMAPNAQPRTAQVLPASPDAITADRLVRPAIALQALARLSEALSRELPSVRPQLALAPTAPLDGATPAAPASPVLLPEAASAELLPGQQILARLAFPVRLATTNAPALRGEANPAGATIAAPETAAGPTGKAPAPDAASLPPAAQPVAAWSAAESQISPAANPAIAALPTQSTAQPRDFAGLIDRLVEAREAAQSTLAPQAVQAALAHADFGRVALHFHQDAAGMTVAMTSPDPDFSRAVQTAAPAAQTSNDTAMPQRQDSPGQSSANAGFGQSQAQSQRRGQSPGRDSADPRPAASPSPRQRNGDEAYARGGIFA